MDRVTFVERKLPRRVETYVERKNRGRVVAVLTSASTAAPHVRGRAASIPREDTDRLGRAPLGRVGALGPLCCYSVTGGGCYSCDVARGETVNEALRVTTIAEHWDVQPLRPSPGVVHTAAKDREYLTQAGDERTVCALETRGRACACQWCPAEWPSPRVPLLRSLRAPHRAPAGVHHW